MKIKPQLPYSTKTSVNYIIRAIESIKPSLGKLEDVNLDLIRKKTGLYLISRDGFSVKNKNREIIFSCDDRFSFRIREQRGNSETDIFVKNNFVETVSGLDKTPAALESFIKNVCKALDFPLLQLRKLLFRDNLEKLTEKLIIPGQLKPSLLQITGEIESLFAEIEANLMTIKSSATRAYIKKNYPSFKNGAQMLKRIDFQGIGKNGEDYSLQILNDRKGSQNIVIRVTDRDSNTQNIIIEPNGKVLKYKNITSRCNLGGRSAYYQQENIDSPEFKEHLITLRDELEKYNAYILNRIGRLEIFKSNYSTESIGVINETGLKTIKRIHKKFDKLRGAMHNLKESDKKELAKRKLGIETVPGDSTIIFKDKETIRLGFPSLKGKDSVKILVLDENENIIKSYCIQDANLVKFNPSSISRGKRNDTQNHYHTQQEIDESGLYEYLALLDKKLNKIMKTISSGQQWYKS